MSVSIVDRCPPLATFLNVKALGDQRKAGLVVGRNPTTVAISLSLDLGVHAVSHLTLSHCVYVILIL